MGLGGFAATAFGIAPMMPDAAELPLRTIDEPLRVQGLDAQLAALGNQRLDLRRSTVSRDNDSAETLLLRLGVADSVAAAFMRQDATARRLLQGRAGKVVQAVSDDDGRLVELVARYPAEDGSQRLSHFSRLTLNKAADAGGAWRARLETAPLATAVRLGSGVIRSSLFGATDEAGLPDAVAMQVAEIFSADIDFHRELRKGDTFSVVYETLTADGEAVPWNDGAGRVLAAEFVNNGKAFRALWFVDAQGRGGYFGADGVSRKRAFLASPLAFSRVTSGFAMRFHPLLKSWRAHLGVDYGAPTGTPVRVVGDGTVKFAGRQNGYGNVIEVQHGNDRSTLYAHLSQIGVRTGQRVSQGDAIGAVGSTGWSTGPHLHFEFRVHGHHENPLKAARDSEAVTLTGADLDRFGQGAAVARSQLQLAADAAGPHNRFE